MLNTGIPGLVVDIRNDKGIPYPEENHTQDGRDALCRIAVGAGDSFVIRIDTHGVTDATFRNLYIQKTVDGSKLRDLWLSGSVTCDGLAGSTLQMHFASTSLDEQPNTVIEREQASKLGYITVEIRGGIRTAVTRSSRTSPDQPQSTMRSSIQQTDSTNTAPVLDEKVFKGRDVKLCTVLGAPHPESEPEPRDNIARRRQETSEPQSRALHINRGNTNVTVKPKGPTYRFTFQYVLKEASSASEHPASNVEGDDDLVFLMEYRPSKRRQINRIKDKTGRIKDEAGDSTESSAGMKHEHTSDVGVKKENEPIVID
ncbi:hypothetical protein KVT40_002492 [Elsinoe batatas]|uniref:Uncharacterized protein n=1 Tax=Elsinoe batatas TaxID=2601811 RepID=A0A8K0L3U2_9PEZI|nr:hypothetical protein KVT40_002492 [Elsinoe batatas]